MSSLKKSQVVIVVCLKQLEIVGDFDKILIH